MVRPCLVVCLALTAGCTQPIRVDDAGRDAPSIDAIAADVPVADVPAADVPPRDTPGIDAPALDAPPSSDAPVDVAPDASGLDAPPSACDMAFGALPGYVLCTESVDTCRFAVTLGGALADCRTVCDTLPTGSCLMAERGSGIEACLAMGNRACGAGGNPVICTCRLR